MIETLVAPPDANDPHSIRRFMNRAERLPQKSESDSLFMLWLLESGIPFHAMESKHLPLWLKAVGAELSGRQTLMTSTLPAIHNAVKSEMKRGLKSIESVAISTDGSKKGADSAVAVVAHFVTTDWILQEYVLGAIANPAEQDAYHIAATVQHRIDDYVGHNVLISTVVTDGGSNYRKSARILAGNGFSCCLHLLALVMSDVCNSESTLPACIEMESIKVCLLCLNAIVVLIFLCISSLEHFYYFRRS